jgi:hypothetical protein
MRRSRGLAAATITWGAWDGGGMAGDLLAQKPRLSLRALQPLSADEGLAALERCLQSAVSQHIIVKCDWESLRTQPGFSATLLTAIGDAAPAARPKPAEAGIRERWQTAPEREGRGILIDYLRAKVLEVLGLAPGFPLAKDRPLISFGLDSLMAVELGNVLSAEFAVRFTPTVVFEHPTLDLLAAHVEGALTRTPATPLSPAAAVPPDLNPTAEFDNLSDDEAEALLEAELQQEERPH